MIIEIILGALMGIIGLGISLLPNATPLPLGLDQSLTTFVSFFGGANMFFPIATLVTIATIVFAIEASIFLFKTVNWVYNKLRGSS